MPRAAIHCFLLLVSVTFGGCAKWPLQVDVPPELRECHMSFARADAQTNTAGAVYRSAVSVPGAPFLRVDRFLASFAAESLSPAATRTWLMAMAHLDAIARASEAQTLGHAQQPDMLNILAECRVKLVEQLLTSPAALAEARARSVVPDEYRTWQRVLGAYALTRHAALRGVQQLHATHGVQTTPPSAVGTRYTFKAMPRAEPVSWKSRARDALGVPQFSDTEWRQLFAEHAPQWEIEQASPDDQIGALVWREGRLEVDTANPTIYTYKSFTRFAGTVLAQLNYVVWFPARPAQGALDIYAGEIDGLTWRVTLDVDGVPLLFDVMHNCGCYHQWYPTTRLTRKPSSTSEHPLDEEPLWQPFAVPAGRIGSAFSIHLAPTTHYVTAVTTHRHAASGMALTPQDYAVLHHLPFGAEGARSVFDDRGIIAQSARLERVLLWPLGVPAPGAMRAPGHHATAFVGRRHFDEAFLLERYYVRGDVN